MTGVQILASPSLGPCRLRELIPFFLPSSCFPLVLLVLFPSSVLSPLLSLPSSLFSFYSFFPIFPFLVLSFFIPFSRLFFLSLSLFHSDIPPIVLLSCASPKICAGDTGDSSSWGDPGLGRDRAKYHYQLVCKEHPVCLPFVSDSAQTSGTLQCGPGACLGAASWAAPALCCSSTCFCPTPRVRECPPLSLLGSSSSSSLLS